MNSQNIDKALTMFWNISRESYGTDNIERGESICEILAPRYKSDSAFRNIVQEIVDRMRRQRHEPRELPEGCHLAAFYCWLIQRHAKG